MFERSKSRTWARLMATSLLISAGFSLLASPVAQAATEYCQTIEADTTGFEIQIEGQPKVVIPSVIDPTVCVTLEGAVERAGQETELGTDCGQPCFRTEWWLIGSGTVTVTLHYYHDNDNDPATDNDWSVEEQQEDVVLGNDLHVCFAIGDPTPPCADDANAAPTASFETTSCIEFTCSFDATGSFDSDGTISSYTWDFGDGQTSTDEPDPSHLYPDAGMYEVVLIVTDNDGAKDSTTKSVTVYAPLTIDTTSLPTATKRVAYSTNLEASGGKPSYSWSVASGTLPSGLSLASDGVLSGTPKKPGTYSFTVHVVDEQEPSTSASRTLTLEVAPR